MLLIMAVLLGLAYTPLSLREERLFYRSVLKTLPLVLMTIYAFWQDAPWIFIIALGLCALGDWLLSLENETGFLYGLIAFALGHLAYIIVFCDAFVMPPLGFVVLLFALLCTVMAFTLKGAGVMRIPVLIYGMIIAVMAIAGVGAWGVSRVGLGIMMFVFSDSLIALQRFSAFAWARNGAARCTIWLTYLLGQALIVYGVI